MAHQKINHVLILFFTLVLFAGCKKESKIYTTATWELINPATGEGFSGVPVSLYEVRYGSSASYLKIWSGTTNENGLAVHKFKAYTSTKYGYTGSADLSVLGALGSDYSVIKQPSPGEMLKDTKNELRYEIVHYHDRITHIKNNNCQGSGDVMRFRQKYLLSGSGNWTIWTPEHALYEGCINEYSQLLSRPLDHVVTEIEVTRQDGSVDNYIDTSYIKGEHPVDTIKVYY